MNFMIYEHLYQQITKILHAFSINDSYLEPEDLKDRPQIKVPHLVQVRVRR